jgi:hypothetical protein
MSSVQLPPWLAVVLAVLALGAPSVAAWVQGRVVAQREDTRWTRERIIQNERWHREHQRDRELRIYEERKSAYIPAILAASEYAKVLGKWHTALHDGEPVNSFSDQADQIALDAFNAVAAVELVGTPEVEDALREVILACNSYATTLDSWISEAQSGAAEQEAVERASSAFQELRRAARRDVEKLLTINPSPPSAPTS